jgi:hypothetical protein
MGVLSTIRLASQDRRAGPEAKGSGQPRLRADQDLKFHEDPSRTRHRPEGNHRETCPN